MISVVPDEAILRASKWCYRGIWAFLTERLDVPQQPPVIQGADDQQVHCYRPAEGFLGYLKLFFWIGCIAIDIGLFVAWCVITYNWPIIGVILAIPFLFLMIVPDVIAYIAIHLRYDTTWYVLSERSMRIRRGIMIIHETTITYDNIQNVSVRQGPVQRAFGISDVVVETAGGGGSVSSESASSLGHSGLLEGISNADELRSLLETKWRQSKTTGLGDDLPEARSRSTAGKGFSLQQVELLEEIQGLAKQLES